MREHDLCPCGSGSPYRECHGARPATEVSRASTSLVGLRLPPSTETRLAREARVRVLAEPGPKKLVLAYPHFSSVTTPPLGVAYLKGYVQRTLADWAVRVVDLNLEAHQELLHTIDERRVYADGVWPEGLLGEIALSRAAETFRGQHPREFYERADRMIEYSLLWNRVFRGALFQQRRDEAAFHGRAPMPALVERQTERVLAERPTAVGISICYVEQLWAGLCLARSIRRADPAMPILLGGTMFKEGIDAQWSAERWPCDYVVSGAGELPIVEILAGRAEAGNVPGVTLVWGDRLHTTPPYYDNDFEAIGQADFSDFEPRAYYSPKPIFPLQTTRGCYWKRCTFCNHYKTVGGAYQLRDVASVISELKRHVDAGVRHFTFVDDIIAPARFNNLSKAILEAGLDIRYHAMTRPMRHFSRETLQRMFDAGCRFVLWGVESGSQRVLDLMEKGTVVRDVEKCLELSAAVGIKNHVFVICGFPTETRDEWQETLDFLQRTRPFIHAVHKTTFGLERGTPVFDDPARFSITRMWPKAGGALYDFECSAGMSRAEARRALDDARPFFRSFAAGKELEKGDFRFRDHMLLLYCRDDERAASRAPVAATAE